MFFSQLVCACPDFLASQYIPHFKQSLEDIVTLWQGWWRHAVNCCLWTRLQLPQATTVKKNSENMFSTHFLMQMLIPHGSQFSYLLYLCWSLPEFSTVCLEGSLIIAQIVFLFRMFVSRNYTVKPRGHKKNEQTNQQILWLSSVDIHYFSYWCAQRPY